MAKEKIGFEHKGIGSVLAHERLTVPLNQREYSWETEHVETLLEDFNHAISGEKQTYFLGTIVLTSPQVGGVPEVADGQQRLATTTILLAAIYDYFIRLGDTARATSIRDHLKTVDIDTGQPVPKLRLNVDDSEFFTKHILSEPDSPERNAPATKQSHRRIAAAASQCREFLDTILGTHKESNRGQVLTSWVKFLRDDAQVILLSVPDHLNAFEMFETLNDRGLKASQADLIKNHLLGQSGDRIHQAQQRWAQMLGTLDALGQSDIAVTFLRHLAICRVGPTRERELFTRVRYIVNSLPNTLSFLEDAAHGATSYAAIFNPEHTLWNDYGMSARDSIRTLLELKVEQIRPLILAIVRRFEPDEAKRALRLCVSWSVRFLIGGGRGGFLDRNYGMRAHAITAGQIKTAKDLSKSMIDVVPPDATFEVAFSEARVSQSFLARYYLRSLERHVQEDDEPEFIPNEQPVINLEHIMPETLGNGWEHIEPEQAAAFWRRLGNMVLLKAKRNVEIGNRPFAAKRATLKESGYLLTAEAALKPTWGPAEISDRQARLAALAVKTWPAGI